MKIKRLARRRSRGVVLSSLVSLGLLMAASVVFADNSYLNTWSSLYPSSASDNNSGCQICHADSTQNLNPYGKAFCDQSGTVAERITAATVQNADGCGSFRTTLGVEETVG